MLKFIFWLLVLANGVAFAAYRGYLGDTAGKDHEPARLAGQVGADKIRIIGASAATAAPAEPEVTAVAPAPAPESEAPPAKPAPACLEIGPFALPDARRFDALLTPLALGNRLVRQTNGEPSSYIVYIPPLPNKEAAEKKAGELRGLGVTNFFVIPDNQPLRGGISLGVFKTEAAAQNQLAALSKQGVRTARVAPRPGNNTRMTFQLRELTPDLRARVERIRLGFPGQDTRLCK